MTIFMMDDDEIFSTHTQIGINYLLIYFFVCFFFLPSLWIEYKGNMVPGCLLLYMQKEITVITSIMKAPPSDATSGTTTLFPFLLLHDEPGEQRLGFPPKLAFTIKNWACYDIVLPNGKPTLLSHATHCCKKRRDKWVAHGEWSQNRGRA